MKPFNTDIDGNAHCIKSNYYKMGRANFLDTSEEGARFKATSVIETNMANQNAIELPSELKGKKFRIRKLTPRECFRLMGVDDKDIDKIQAAGISNSGQYKLAGNSIVVDVLYYIFLKAFIEPEADIDHGEQLSLF
jgi:site-specific DNA-cytosine methylase